MIFNCVNLSRGLIVLDAFCGCGGNGIAFARRPATEISLVICVDIDRSKLKKAAHNASIYGIERDKIVFIEGDSINIMKGKMLEKKGLTDFLCIYIRRS